MKVTWLGQAGLLFRTEKTVILVDPYFSDSASSVAAHRKMPIDPSVWEIKPDLLLCTHDHIDHNDPQTMPRFLNRQSCVTVLSPRSVWEKVRAYPGDHNFVLVAPGVVWTHEDVTVATVAAVHSDPFSVGFVIEYDGKKYYVTGDTLYHPTLLQGIPKGIDVVFLPINGAGNNMNARDATKFAKEIDAKIAVPIHFGMLDDIDPHTFLYENALIPKIYKEFVL